MKKICFLICIFASTLVNAQEKIVVKETFENNKFQWSEFYEKDQSGGIEAEYFVLKNKTKKNPALSKAELPITIGENFKITFKFLVPKISGDYYFGIIFNYKSNKNYDKFLVTERKFQILNDDDDIVDRGMLILKSGKNKEVSIEIEKKGTKLIFRVDDIEAATITGEINSNSFGFMVEGKNTIRVNEVIIEQRAAEE